MDSFPPDVRQRHLDRVPVLAPGRRHSRRTQRREHRPVRRPRTGRPGEGADVAANAVNGANIVNNSVTGGDVNESTLKGLVRGRMLDFNLAATGPPAAPQPIATVGPYKLSGTCVSNPGSLGLGVYATGPAGFAETEFSQVDNDTTDAGDQSQSSVPPANVETKVIKLNADSGFGRDGGTLVIRSNTGGWSRFSSVPRWTRTPLPRVLATSGAPPPRGREGPKPSKPPGCGSRRCRRRTWRSCAAHSMLGTAATSTPS